MSTVRQRRKNGRVYVYESHNVWDKETKRVRAVRTYLGREDPETGELIPSSGRPGRTPAADVPAMGCGDAVPAQGTRAAADAPADEPGERVAELASRLEAVMAERDALRAERDGLRAELASAMSAVSTALSALSALSAV